jgi:hypothetical protein
MWSTFDEKWKDPILQLISGTYFTKKSFLPLGKWKKRFYSKKIIIAMQTLSTMVTPMVVPNLDMLL